MEEFWKKYLEKLLMALLAKFFGENSGEILEELLAELPEKLLPELPEELLGKFTE